MKKGDIISQSLTHTREGSKPRTSYVRGRVTWVIEEEVAYLNLDEGTYGIFNLSDKSWVVEVSAAPTFQSSVEGMSEEELRASISSLRTSRHASVPKLTHPGTPKVREKKSEMEKALDKLDPEKRKELMRKLGMSDE